MGIVGGFGIVVGLLVIGLWAGSLRAGRVPELVTTPWAIRFHLAAELIMAATLIVSGVATVAGLEAGSRWLAVGFGMTLYSIVNSAGYYAERRELPPLAMFAALLVLTVAATVWLIAA